MSRRQAKLLYNKVHPILISLAQSSGEEMLKRKLQEKTAFWVGFEKNALDLPEARQGSNALKPSLIRRGSKVRYVRQKPRPLI